MSAEPGVGLENCICKKSTQKALLIEYDGEEYWIPISHVLDDSEVWREGDEGLLVISQWIAEQKGLV